MTDKFLPTGECINCDGSGKDPDSLRYDYVAFPDFCPDCFGCGKRLKLQTPIKLQMNVK